MRIENGDLLQRKMGTCRRKRGTCQKRGALMPRRANTQRILDLRTWSNLSYVNEKGHLSKECHNRSFLYHFPKESYKYLQYQTSTIVTFKGQAPDVNNHI